MRMSMVEEEEDEHHHHHHHHNSNSNSNSNSSYYDTSSSSSSSWQDQLASLVETTGIQHHYQYSSSPAGDGDGYGFGVLPAPQLKTTMDLDFDFNNNLVVVQESFRDQVHGFLKASAEMVQVLAIACKDVIQQSAANTYFASKCSHLSHKLSFFNHFLPEDRHPLHAWPIIFSVFFIALAVLTVNNAPQSPPSMPKKVYLHPPSATRVQLPDGRHIAYYEQGVPAKSARFSLVSPHSFLSSRLAGIPGIKETLLEEFGIRLITYDLPGFGESDPHPNRDLNTSAMDMLCLADAVGINDKFWVVGYSGGGMHAWAALSYIPDRLAGAAMFAPIVNPYDSSMTKEEKLRIWEKWTRRRKLMYFLARRFPFLLTYFYRRSFLSGAHGQLDKWLSLSLGQKDRSLIAEHIFEEFWQRDVEESVRQGHIKPFIEEAFLQVSNWGFSLADIRVQKKRQEKGILPWLKSMYSQAELEWAGFLGPIHIWQGMDDQVVTPSTAEFVSRLVPRTTLHKLEGEGHLSYFWFCDECHRQIMLALFGEPRGPLTSTKEEVDVTSSEEHEESDEVLVPDPET